VIDVCYFSDGFGIPGVEGDEIQLEGGVQRGRIVTIDYARSILVLDKTLAWADDQGVTLAYEGKAPDMGAFEYRP
jgi:hypothetical protein